MADSIFHDRDVLEFEEVMPSIAGRDTEIRRAISEFQDGPLNVTPASAVYYGPPKAGKTATLQMACAEMRTLAAQNPDYDIEILRIQLQTLDSMHDLWFAILCQQGHETSQEVPRKKRKYTTYDWLTGEIERCVRNRDADLYVFALDDIDTIDTPETALETILHMDSEYDGPRVGFIATATAHDLIDSTHHLKRKYCTSEITLGVLKERAYRDALESHAAAAFKDAAITEAAIETIHERCFDAVRIGDAIAILKRAGDCAAQATAEQVEVSHAEEAIDDYNIQLGVNWLLDRSLDVHNQAILLSLVDTDTEAVRCRTLYDEYAAILNDTDVKPLSYRRFRDRVTGEILEPFVATEKRNEGSHGGVYFETRLNCDPNVVYTALNNEDYQDLPESYLPDASGTHFPNFDWQLS